MNRKAGDIFIVGRHQNSLKYKVCRQCLKPIEAGQKVVVRSKGYSNPKWTRLVHFECFKDAHGELMIDAE